MVFLASASAFAAGCGGSQVVTPPSIRSRVPQFITPICTPDQDCSGGGGPTPRPVPQYANRYSTAGAGQQGAFSYDASGANLAGSVKDANGSVTTQGTVQATYGTQSVTSNHTYYVPALQANVVATLTSPAPSDINQVQTATLSNGGSITRTAVDVNTVRAMVNGPGGQIWNATLSTQDRITYNISWSGTSSGSLTLSTGGISTSSTRRSPSRMSAADCHNTHKLALAADGVGLALAFCGPAAPAGLMIAAFGFAVGVGAELQGC